MEILDNGKYGVLVPVGDKEKMAEAIIQSLNGLERHRNMTKEFNKNELYKYRLEYAADRYLKILLG
jgi:glycosyltransferase involved in cell wall biosynthesis